MPKLTFWFGREGGGTMNTIQGIGVIKRSFGKVYLEESIGDTIKDILLANASKNGEIWLEITG